MRLIAKQWNSVMFTTCTEYWIVNTSFSRGLLVPILKKTTLDPTIAKNYRPITFSNTLSKILELYILSDLQFWLDSGRGTDMAKYLANDVCSYCTKRGSPVYICSLDAEGVFDSVPHSVLFKKSFKCSTWSLLESNGSLVQLYYCAY